MMNNNIICDFDAKIVFFIELAKPIGYSFTKNKKNLFMFRIHTNITIQRIIFFSRLQ